MEVLRPEEHDVAESTKLVTELIRVGKTLAPPTEPELVKYVDTFWAAYELAVATYFKSIAEHLPLHAGFPYESIILRLGGHAVMFAHTRKEAASIRVASLAELGVSESELNVFTLKEQLGCTFLEWSFRPKPHTVQEATEDARRRAFQEALSYFWQVFDPSKFEALCIRLLTNEGFLVSPAMSEADPIDASGTLEILEPGGFRRRERWACEFKHHQAGRVSAEYVAGLPERLLAEFPEQHDVGCLLTSSDLTSIGARIASLNDRLRVWDRTVLDALLHKHPDVLADYFADYATALAQVATPGDSAATELRAECLRGDLLACPVGHAHFRRYEELGLKVLSFLLGDEIGPPKPQSSTADKSQRRDVLCRNNRRSRFMQRVAERFGADFIVVDFKNYAEPVDGDVVDDVQKYANDAVGRFLLVVARKGGSDSAATAQRRHLRDQDTCVLVLSDQHCVEMLARKASGGEPLDVIEDLYDSFLRSY